MRAVFDILARRIGARTFAGAWRFCVSVRKNRQRLPGPGFRATVVGGVLGALDCVALLLRRAIVAVLCS